jgi:hypothetical protein
VYVLRSKKWDYDNDDQACCVTWQSYKGVKYEYSFSKFAFSCIVRH